MATTPSVLSQLNVKINSNHAAKAQPTHTIPLLVSEYVINEKDPSKSFVKGIIADSNDKAEVKVYLDSSGANKMTINGFKSLQDGHDPKFDYAVPVRGIIAFEGCKPTPGAENTYVASWAKGIRRKENQTAHTLMTTMKIYPASGGREVGAIIFNGYRPDSAEAINMKSSKSPVDDVRNALSEALNPRRGPEGNLSLALLRIHNASAGANEKPVAIELKGLRSDNLHQPGSIALEKWESSDLGKAVMNELLPNQLAGNDFVIEVVPGVRYFAAPSAAAPFFYGKNQAEDHEVGKIIPSSFASKLSGKLNSTTTVAGEENKPVTVTQPKFIPMVLGTYIHDNGNSMITYFKPTSSNSPIYTADNMPTPYLEGTKMQQTNTQEQTMTQQKQSAPAANPPQEKQPPAQQAAPEDDANLDLGTEVSEDDMAELDAIAREMNMGMGMTP